MEYYVSPEFNQKETIELKLTPYEAKVIVGYLSKADHRQINEPFINSILKKLKS
tara:strand:+ start:3402 stop:3563 length:162 start_codon:yes stop_codon:yes gene_type:complete